jgi:type I restriction enzyme R subunit
VFRKDVGSFVRLYDFMSQIIDYGDTDLEKRSVYLRLLERQIRPENYTAEIDLSEVELVNIKQIDRGQTDIKLGVENVGLEGITAAGSAASKDPKMVLLQAVLDRLNDLFGSEDFTTAQKESWLEGLLKALLDNHRLVTQAKVNSKQQFLDSPDLHDAVVVAVLGNQTSQNKMADYFTSRGEIEVAIVESLGELVHLYAQEQPA